ncbi:CBS domain-containing protein [Candidatus Saccharibacteria bacterium]|nr:CBS domain-containing protein [Candidatus Saccharibacteria bacterium]
MISVILGVLYVAVVILLLGIMGVRPQFTQYRRSELQRRIDRGDEGAKALLRRDDYLPDIFSLQRVITALLLVSLAAIGVGLFHWFTGFVLSLIIALESGAVARLPLFQRRSQRLYEKYESKILSFIERHPHFFHAIRTVSPVPADNFDIESREELVQLIEQSGPVISRQEQTMLTNTLTFSERKVKEVMTPRKVVDTVDYDEILGPLRLDELHKTGHTRFPVLRDGNVDAIVGVLHTTRLSQVGAHSTTRTVAEEMDSEVYSVDENDSLRQALGLFIRTKHHMAIVTNEFHEMVGIVTLEDILEALLGTSIMDEDDVYRDLRAVARRKNPVN